MKQEKPTPEEVESLRRITAEGSRGALAKLQTPEFLKRPAVTRLPVSEAAMSPRAPEASLGSIPLRASVEESEDADR